MDVWMTFAYISNSIVANIACFLYTGYGEANELAKSFCGDPQAIAVDVTHTPVEIGDRYMNGSFSRYNQSTGLWVVINPLPTVVDQTSQNTSDITNHSSSIDDLWVAVLEG